MSLQIRASSDDPSSNGELPGTRPSSADDQATAQARLLRGLATRCFEPAQLVRPGHTFPLRARPGGVLKRAGHTEAAVDLCRLAGRGDVAALGQIVDERGSLRRLPALREFAERHEVPLVSVADVIRHRLRQDRLVEHVAEARIPTEHGEFVAHGFRSVVDGDEHVAYVMGDVRIGPPPLVRVHSECLTGDILASTRCDCGDQLQLALRTIAREGRGVFVYLRGHEGRGIGLAHKLRAYALQDRGLDTVDANAALGLPVDSREYGIGAQILAELGVAEMRLLTNNPDKLGGLEGFGLRVVERVPIETRPRAENLRYLQTKRRRMGHLLGGSGMRA